MTTYAISFAMGLLAIACVPAKSTTIDVSAQNNTGGDVYDIHITFSGTGGTIHNLVPVSPKPQTMDAGSGMQAGSEVNGAWTTALGNGHYWEAEFDVDFTDLTVAQAYWTDANHQFVANIPLTDVVFGQTPEPASELLTGAALVLLGCIGRRGRDMIKKGLLTDAAPKTAGQEESATGCE